MENKEIRRNKLIIITRFVKEIDMEFKIIKIVTTKLLTRKGVVPKPKINIPSPLRRSFYNAESNIFIYLLKFIS